MDYYSKNKSIYLCLSACAIIFLTIPHTSYTQDYDNFLPLRGESGEITLGLGKPLCVAFSPDGSMIAVATLRGLTIWDIQDDQLYLKCFFETDYIKVMQFVPGTNLLLAHSNAYPMLFDLDQNKELWDIPNKPEIFSTYFRQPLHSLDVSTDGKLALFGGSESSIVMEIETGEVINFWTPKGYSGRSESVFSSDGKSVLSFIKVSPNPSHPMEEQYVEWIDITTGEISHTFDLLDLGKILDIVAFSDDGKSLLVYGFNSANDNENYFFYLFDLENETLQTEFSTKIAGYVNGGFPHDDQYVIVGGYATQPIFHAGGGATMGTAPRIWDRLTGEEAFSFEGECEGFRYIDFSPDGDLFITRHNDNTLLLWSIKQKKLLTSFTGFVGYLSDAVFTPDGTKVVSCSGESEDFDPTIRIWDSETGKNIRTLTGLNGAAICVNISSDGQLVAAGANDGAAKVWRFDSGEELLTLEGHSDQINDIVFSPIGDRIATASEDGTIVIWNTENGESLLKYLEHEGPARCVDFSTDGKQVISGSGEFNKGIGQALLWQTETGDLINDFPVSKSAVFSVEFSPDGRYIIAGFLGTEAIVWDAATGEEISVFNKHTNGIHKACFSPDGRFMAAGSTAFGANLYDAHTRTHIKTLDQIGAMINIDLSSNGKLLLNSSVWDISEWTELPGWMLY